MNKALTFLLFIHIAFGTIALMSGCMALISAKGQIWHRQFGRLFFWGMNGIFFTALPLALAKANLFLFLIALFSYYLAFTGWRYAKNRIGLVAPLDFVVNRIMLFSSISMLGFSIYQFYYDSPYALVLSVFGILGFILAFTDYRQYHNKTIRGKERIAKHLVSMLGGLIAVITAFSVTNIPLTPPLILWLGPTVLITPLIFWWKNKVLKGNYKNLP